MNMSNLIIAKRPVSEIVNSPGFSEMLAEYANELAMDGLPHPAAKIEMYSQLEALGKLHIIAAYIDDIIIGLMNILMVTNPHYGIDIAVSESFFVNKSFRHTGAGLKLLRAGEDCAKEIGSPGLFVSGPSDGALVEILPHRDYEEKSRTFFKVFNK